MDRFLLAENPMNESGSIAIIHTVDPVAIVEVHEEHLEFKEGTYFQHFTHHNLDDVDEDFTLRLHFQFSTSFADGEAQAREVDQLFKRAWRWYQSYMNWEDKQIL
jgi:hypothetical protein